MAEPIWEKFLTERDKAVLTASRHGTRGGWGERPALLVIDANYAFCGDRSEPILDAIKRWPTACGEEAWSAVGEIRRLIDAARDKGVPVIYTTNSWRDDKWDAGSWRWKTPRDGSHLKTETVNRDGNQIVEEIAPAENDIVVRKQKPSGFFGTGLLSYLVLLKCDSVIVTGGTTSGCVRATTVDAFSNNFRVAIPAGACFDRVTLSHAASLCDMHAKYADIVDTDETVGFIKSLPDGLFELPGGQDL